MRALSPCAMNINGVNTLACTKDMGEIEGSIRIYPLRYYRHHARACEYSIMGIPVQVRGLAIVVPTRTHSLRRSSAKTRPPTAAACASIWGRLPTRMWVFTLSTRRRLTGPLAERRVRQAGRGPTWELYWANYGTQGRTLSALFWTATLGAIYAGKCKARRLVQRIRRSSAKFVGDKASMNWR